MSNITYQHWTVGSHIGFDGTIEKSVNNIIVNGGYACQFFMGNPKSYKRTRISDIDVERTNKILSKYPTCVYTHFPYLANLAGSKNILAWEGNEQDKNTIYTLSELEYELNTIAKLNCSGSGVVIHPGNHKNKQEGLKAISKSINRINFDENAMLLLENAAGEGTKLCCTLQEIKDVLDGVDEKKRDNVGVCIDTCHLFVYGEYDIMRYEEVDRFFKDFDELIGLEHFKLLHLNDSEVRFKGKVDRHAMIGTGYIWNEDLTSLIHLMDLCEENNIPMVLETTPQDLYTLSNLK